MAGVAGAEAAARERRARRLLEVARLQLTGFVDRVRPAAREAVGLQLEGLRRFPHLVVEDAELLLQVVGVLMREDVRHGEVAGGAFVAGPLARQPAPDAAGAAG